MKLACAIMSDLFSINWRIEIHWDPQFGTKPSGGPYLAPVCFTLLRCQSSTSWSGSHLPQDVFDRHERRHVLRFNAYHAGDIWRCWMTMFIRIYQIIPYQTLAMMLLINSNKLWKWEIVQNEQTSFAKKPFIALSESQSFRMLGKIVCLFLKQLTAYP